ncbi:MAG: FtsX-like permease family protein [Candidatus Choladocola sp.]|nr:FtsX-like permease family protein [Candidatus Choladocola sp.]
MSKKRKNIYARLACTGIVKNYRMYVPYLLTCIGMVMMHYILYFLMESEQIAAMKGGDTLQTMLSYGSGVFCIFAVIFLFYTSSFLIRSRKREFGLYNILGMDKRNLARILIWENVIVAFLSFLGGLFCGILFSKLAELCMAYVLEEKAGMAISIGWGPMAKTVRLFLVIFLLILLNALFQVGKAKPIDLLHSNAVGEKPPKGNRLFAFVGVILLAAAYCIAIKIEDPMSAFMLFFVAVGMVIISTYLLFISGSVVFCRILRKNKKYYYKPNHFISVSSMQYRMKRNGAGLASICILSTMVLVMLSSTACMYFGNEDRLKERYQRQIELYEYTFDAGYKEKIEETVDHVLSGLQVEKENLLSYGFLSMAGYSDGAEVLLNEEEVIEEFGVFDYSKMTDIYLVPVEDYNRLMGKEEKLGKNEVILYSTGNDYEYDTITLEGNDVWKVKNLADSFVKDGNTMATIFDTLYLFVPDQSYIDHVETLQKEYYGNNISTKTTYYGFDISAGEELQQEAAAQISAALDKMEEEDGNFPSVEQQCRAAQRADFYALYSGLFVLGILLAIVFVAATVLIMYYKQITEGFEDQARFDIMRKVGMTKREIRSSIHSQMFTVFLLPLLLAGIHTGFAFPIVQKLLLLFAVTNTKLLVITTVLAFLLFAVFYTVVYVLTSRVYYKIVSGAK